MRMVRFVLRVALAASITAVGATLTGALALLEATAIGEAATFRECVTGAAAALWSGLVLGFFALAFTFLPAAGAAAIGGGLLWRAGRNSAAARSLLLWAAAGAGCGAVVSDGLLYGIAEKIAPASFMTGGCGVLTGAVAAAEFRALMALLPLGRNRDEMAAGAASGAPCGCRRPGGYIRR
jgi:hypothetical protein